MDQDTLNMSVRRYLKTVGITAQREIERAVAAAASLPPGTRLEATTRVTIAAIGLDVTVPGVIDVG